MSNKKKRQGSSNGLPATVASPAADETPEQRRARQIKEWEEKKRSKERKEHSKNSASPMLWLATGAGAIVLVITLGVVVLQGGSSGASDAATPAPDRRTAGLPVDQTVEIIADDQGQANNPTFDPTVVTGRSGEVIEFKLINEGSVAHNINVSGPDKEYGTPDDFFMESLNAGEEGTMKVKIDESGTYPFRCDLHPLQQVGNLILS